ncbi:hypothetical protein LTR33_018927 [Friedmanniomyces endolithicus]|nr:hypothetical protein LTR33_018927 [Friedmanniomyces endolithicus]
MDALIPFCERLEGEADLGRAVEAAEKGAESTRGMKATFGRAAYVGEQGAETQQDAPPDPGAMAAAIFLRGFLDGMGTKQ